MILDTLTEPQKADISYWSTIKSLLYGKGETSWQTAWTKY
jgi:hypothetical protein